MIAVCELILDTNFLLPYWVAFTYSTENTNKLWRNVMGYRTQYYKTRTWTILPALQAIMLEQSFLPTSAPTTSPTGVHTHFIAPLTVLSQPYSYCTMNNMHYFHEKP